MATAPKKKVLDKNGDQFFPITHINAVIDGQGSNVETIISNKQDTLVSGTNIKTINNTSLLGSGNIDIQGGGSAEITEGTWSEIIALRNNSQLNPGAWYRITDYVATTSQANTESAGVRFDIILLATSVDSFSEEAKAKMNTAFETATPYFSAADPASNLDAWKIWYCIDNDSNRFYWASNSGKGVIYRMIDEYGNDCPYDFKGIKFICSSSNYNEDWILHVTGEESGTFSFFTFSAIYTQISRPISDASVWCQRDVGWDGSTIRPGVLNNIIKPAYDSDSGRTYRVQRLNGNLFVDTDRFSYFDGFRDNVLENDCVRNCFADGCNNNHIELAGSGNCFCSRCVNNKMGAYCVGNFLASNSYNNCFKEYCSYNYLDYNNVNVYNAYNTFNGNCNQNYFNGLVSSEIGSNCNYLNIQNCSSVEIGERCSEIILSNFKSIKIANDCYHIEFSQRSGAQHDVWIKYPIRYINFIWNWSGVQIEEISDWNGTYNNITIFSGNTTSDFTGGGWHFGKIGSGVDFYIDSQFSYYTSSAYPHGANKVLATPSDSSGRVGLRNLVAADLPNYILYRSLPEEKRPLTFEILTSGTIAWAHFGSSQTIQYSKNGGPWNSLTSTTSGASISVAAGDVVMFKGSAWPGESISVQRTFGGTATFEAYGNPASLKYGEVLTGLESISAYCYASLFFQCVGLMRAPALPATTLAERCYYQMFSGCTNLKKAPLLPAESAHTGSYYYMFSGCTSLNEITCLLTSRASTSLSGWTYNISATGTLYKPYGLTYDSGSTGGIPSGWNVEIIDAPTIIDIPAFRNIDASGEVYASKAAAISALGIDERLFDALINGEITPYLRTLNLADARFIMQYEGYSDYDWDEAIQANATIVHFSIGTRYNSCVISKENEGSRYVLYGLYERIE